LYEPESKVCGGLDYMVLDAQALQHLEIVEAADGKLKGTLLNYVDLCSTLFGKRQMKRWLLAPLFNKERINERLDAVADLMSHQDECCKFRAKMSRLPDLEKLLAKIFTYSVKHAVEAIYFEDVNLQKMREFKQLLDCFKGISTIVEDL
jgi:DNA mismatch repair protein MSH6